MAQTESTKIMFGVNEFSSRRQNHKRGVAEGKILLHLKAHEKITEMPIVTQCLLRMMLSNTNVISHSRHGNAENVLAHLASFLWRMALIHGAFDSSLPPLSNGPHLFSSWQLPFKMFCFI